MTRLLFLAAASTIALAGCSNLNYRDLSSPMERTRGGAPIIVHRGHTAPSSQFAPPPPPFAPAPPFAHHSAGPGLPPQLGPAAGLSAPPAPLYVARSAASDLFEITSSRVALDKSRNPDVRRFAQTMIDHHTRTTEQLTRAARASGLTPPPPTLEPQQVEMLRQLEGEAPSPAFDRLYVNQQLNSHQQALELQATYGAGGDAPALREAALQTAPVVAEHLEEAGRLNGVM